MVIVTNSSISYLPTRKDKSGFVQLFSRSLAFFILLFSPLFFFFSSVVSTKGTQLRLGPICNHPQSVIIVVIVVTVVAERGGQLVVGNSCCLWFHCGL